MKRKYLSLAEKAVIVTEAFSQPCNVSRTAQKHNVARSQIRRWKKTLRTLEKSNLDETNKRRVLGLSRFHAKERREDSEVYIHLKNYLEELRDKHRIVTVQMLCREWQRVNPSANVSSVAVRSRIYRWLKHEGIVQRRPTHVSQHTRHCKKTMNDFLCYVQEQVRDFGFTEDTLLNMDETNVEFDMVGHSTLNKRGEKTVTVRKSGSSSRCTVVLTVTRSGEKLCPFVVFKGKKNGRFAREFSVLSYPESCSFTVQEKAWVDKVTLLEWVKEVLEPYAKSKSKVYLLLDEARPHLASATDLRKVCSELDFIPGGFTSKLQVLDVSVNAPFKTAVRECYEDWMRDNPEGRPARVDVAHWVDKAWQRVSPDTIRHGWRKVGL